MGARAAEAAHRRLKPPEDSRSMDLPRSMITDREAAAARGATPNQLRQENLY
jgi:hypothetical protein